MKYQIIARNLRLKSGELDIIARDGNCLVFVEVKTRVAGSLIAPADSVGSQKQAQLRRLAEHYLETRQVPECDIRFDIISVIARGARPEIEHIRDAF